jgi:hypothetical protein
MGAFESGLDGTGRFKYSARSKVQLWEVWLVDARCGLFVELALVWERAGWCLIRLCGSHLGEAWLLSYL